MLPAAEAWALDAALPLLPTPAEFSLASLKSLIVFMLAFSAVIFVHELGHFLAAKFCGVRVDEFAIGMPPRLLSIRVGETAYTIGMLPIGGYVKMLGQIDPGTSEGEGEGAEPEDASKNPRSFANKKIWQRAVILSAGVVMNVIFAALLFVVLFRSGSITRTSAEVGTLVPDGAAAKARDAGKPTLLPGDVITELNHVGIRYFEQIRIENLLADGEAPLALKVRRNGQDVAFELDRSDVAPAEMGIKPLGFLPAVTLTVPAGNTAAGLLPGETVTGLRGPGEKDFSPVARHDQLEDAFARWAGKPVTLQVRPPADAAADAGNGPTAADGPAPREVVVVPAVPTPETRGTDTGVLFDSLLPRTRITAVSPGSPAEQAGLLPDDVLVEVDGAPWPTAQTVIDAVGKAAREGSKLTFVVRREGAKLAVVIPAVPGKTPQIGVGMSPDAWEDYVVGQVGTGRVMSGEVIAVLKKNAVLPAPLVARLSALRNGRFQTEEELKAALEKARVPAELIEGHAAAVFQALDRLRADEAGFRPGDVITSLAGHKTASWNDVVRAVYEASPAAGVRDPKDGRVVRTRVPVTVRRDGKDVALTVALQPREYEVRSLPVGIGVGFGAKTVRLSAAGVREAVSMGAAETVYFIRQVYATLRQLLTGRMGAEGLSGPVGIVAVGAQVAREDSAYMWYVVAMISVNLAVINFLPLPILDGGHIVLLMLEKLRGRPVSPAMQDKITLAGLVLLVSLFVFVTFNDLSRLLGG